MTVDIRLIGYDYTNNEHKYAALDPDTKAILVKEIGLDHGELAGLEDDDHVQYYNSVRHTKAIHDALGLDHGSLSGKADDDHAQYYNQARGDARYLRLAGGTMTGLLTLSGAPTADLHASTKKYVDDHVGAGNLSELTIDAHKDWAAKNITNMGTIEHKGATLKSGIQTEGRCSAYIMDPTANFASEDDAGAQGVFREKMTNTPSSITLSNAPDTGNDYVLDVMVGNISKFGFYLRVRTTGGHAYFGSYSKKYVTVGN